MGRITCVVTAFSKRRRHMADVPSMRELLGDNPPQNWGKWGSDDEVGSLNYLDPEQVLRGVASVREGKVFTLQRLIGDPKGDPVWPGPRAASSATRSSTRSSCESGNGPSFPGGLHYADDKIGRLPPGLDAVRRARPRLVRRQDLERPRRRHHDRRRHELGVDPPIARAGRRRPRRAARHGALPRQEHARQGRDVHPRGPRGRRREARASRSRSATSCSSARTSCSCSTTQGEAFYEGFNEPGLIYSPRAGAVVPGHGDPEPRHRHHRQRGDRRPQHRRRCCRCTAR